MPVLTSEARMINLRSTVEAVLRKAPAWIRHDLASADLQVRVRAEEALAAMIEDALADRT